MSEDQGPMMNPPHGVPSQGSDAVQREASLSDAKREAFEARQREFALPGADSISDPNITTFSRGFDPLYAGISTMLKLPYLQDINKMSEYDVGFVGVPFDLGTTFRPGTRFGPQGLRRASAQYTSFYSFEMGVDLLKH